VLGGLLESEQGAEPGPEMLGVYELRRKLGEGGYGEVWKAWDPRLRRPVALKRLKSADPDERRRFLNEARLAAGLSHPHVAPVHEVGECDGEPYLAMKMVHGETLRNLVEKNSEARDPRTLAALVRDASRGVAAAHERSIVHCDLKPENLLVERREDGKGWHVYVTDFGLAKRTRPGEGATLSGAVGTPSYMAPEQVAGTRVDARTDVYALGATLYALLVRRPPFLGETAPQVLRAILEADPVPLRKLSPALDRDLETIVHKCLAKEPARRYASAHDFADELDRWLEGRPILARRPSLLYRAAKALRRRRGVAVTVALAGVAIAALLAWLVPRMIRAERSAALWTQVSVLLSDADGLARAGETERARRTLDAGVALCEKESDLPHARYFLGRLLRARGDRARAREALDAALEADPSLGEARLERGLLLVQEYSDGLAFAFENFGSRLGTGDYRDPPNADKAEDLVPGMREIREAAARDLESTVGRSLYFRPADALFGAAEFLRLRRDYDGARRRLLEVLEADPLQVGAHLSLSRIAWDTKRDFAEAELHANRAIELYRGLGPAYGWRSSLLLQQGRLVPDKEEQKRLFARSLADTEKAISLGAPTAGAHARRAAARLDNGDVEGALADFEAAVRLNPRYSMAWNGLGNAHLGAGRDARARESYDRAIELDPDNAWAFYNRGLARRRLADYPGSDRDFTRVLELQPAWYEPFYERGETRRLEGRLDEALADFEAALTRHPDWQSLRGRGLIRAARGDVERGSADLREALAAMRPGDPARPGLEADLAEICGGE
jgi:serine/threonine-protein kinase